MLKELALRETALELLLLVYQNMDTTFEATVTIAPANAVSSTDFLIATEYLKQKRYVEYATITDNKLSCRLNVDGIDWVEDCRGSSISYRRTQKVEITNSQLQVHTR